MLRNIGIIGLLLGSVVLASIMAGCGVEEPYTTTTFASGTISGIVHDNNGNPASDVTVSLKSSDASAVSVSAFSTQVTTSGADGSFEFDGVSDGTYNVQADQSNTYKVINQNITISGGNSVNLGTLTLAQTGAITGYAYFVDKSSHLGIDVFIPGTSFTAKTAADGSYSILYIPAGTFDVTAMYTAYQTTSEAGIVVQSASTTTVPNILVYPQAGGTYGGVTFTAVDKYQGTKLQSVEVTIGYVTKTTDSNGEVTFDTVWAASQSFTASKSAYSTYSGAVTITANTTVTETIYITTSTFSVLTIGGTQGSGDGQFDSPSGVAVDSSGNIYVADNTNRRVQKFNSSGTFLTKWGSNGSGDGQFSYLCGIAVDSNNNVYVVDKNDRVQKFNSSGTFLTKWGSSGSGDGQFSIPGVPNGIAVDSNDNVYVVDGGNYRIQKFDSNGSYIMKFGSQGTGDGQFSGLYGVNVDSAGNIYTFQGGSNARVQKFNSSGSFLTKWGSVGSGDGEFGAGLYPASAGVGFNSFANVFVTDSGGNDRIQVFDSAGNFLSKWGSTGNGEGEFNRPMHLTVDSSNNIYVVDNANNRIQVFKP